MINLEQGKVNMMLDGQFGSTGKGLFAGYVSKHNKIDIAVTNAAPNAGHTYKDTEGNSFTCFHLPVSGVLQKNSLIYLCAGTIIDPEKLAKEMVDLGVDWRRLRIHPRAAVIEEIDKAVEGSINSSVAKIASTQKGGGSALARKIMRSAKLAVDFYGPDVIEDLDINRACSGGQTIFMEVPQGMDLGINGGFSYPHCTSREVSVSQALSDLCAHPSLLGKVAVTMRTYPIRVGHIYGSDSEIIGHSGPFYKDQRELDWQEFDMKPELTTVTKRPRRIAEWSWHQYEKCLSRFKPDYIFLNFCNYFKSYEYLNEFIGEMCSGTRTSIHREQIYTGFSPFVEDVFNHEQAGEAHMKFWRNGHE